MDFVMRYLKLIPIGLAIAFTLGCGSTQKNLPAPALPQEEISVSVLIDSLAVFDITGSTDGVYQDFQTLLSEEIARLSETRLPNLNVTDVTVVSGLMYQAKPEAKFMFAKDDKPTQQEFHTTFHQQAQEIYGEESFISFYRELMATGLQTAGRYKGSYDIQVPESLQQKLPDYILMVSSQFYHVPTSKSMAIGIGTGLVSGGTFYTMYKGGGNSSVALLGTKQNKVVWFFSRNVGNYGKLTAQAAKFLQILNQDSALIRGEAVPARQYPPAKKEGHSNILELKIALRSGYMDRDTYDVRAEELEEQLEQRIEALEEREKSGELSEPALDLLTYQEKKKFKGDY